MATETTRVTKRERREQRRAEEKRKAEEAARRSQTTRYVTMGVVGVLIVLGLALAWGPISGLFNRGANAAAAQGQQFANQGQEHIAVGATHAPYNSNPPTSGPHYGDPAAWGIYDRTLPDEQLVHNLEHGGIWIAYNCPDGCPELVQQLKDLAGQYKSKIVLEPRPNKDVPTRINLMAWTWLDGFNDFDAARITAFIAAHKDHAPEFFPD
jgi:hypothetical protein